MTRDIPLFPKTLCQSTYLSTAGKWTVEEVPARLELSTEGTPLPGGWVLLRGRVLRWEGDFSAVLLAETGGAAAGAQIFPLPVSRKGTILELLRLPDNVTRLVLEPMRSPGSFELQALSLTPVGQLERTVRMWRRVVPLYFNFSRERRHRAGLYAHTPLVNLREAYRIAGRFRAYAPGVDYEQWIEQFDMLTSRDRRLIDKHIARWRNPPAFRVIIAICGCDASGLEQTIDSVQRQCYRSVRISLLVSPQANFEREGLALDTSIDVLIAGRDADPVAMADSGREEAAGSTWLICMRPGEVLAEHALYWLAHEAMKSADTGFIYADHDCLREGGKRDNPVFKPDWSPELLRSTNYIGAAAAIRADLLAGAGGLGGENPFAPDRHDLYLRVTERLTGTAIRHIPAVLWHLPDCRAATMEPPVTTAGNPVAAHLRRLKVAATVERAVVGHFRVNYTVPPDSPKVSIIVPTRDALPHLRACVESVLGKSSYANFELLVVDNQSSEPETLTYLEALLGKPRVRVLRYPHPFNYSAINNFAAEEAKGAVLCLLNNDTEVISSGWLEEMLGHLLQPGVGVVGAKLYYSDGRVQHAGDMVGAGGCAHHLHSLLGRDEPGYCDRAILAQDLSAVTAACLMTWRQLFLELGGLNSRDLPVSFNDVDYCLRVREAGRRVVWTPYAELYHHESVSRGKDEQPEKAERTRREADWMRRRWQHVMNHDPFYNPNLSYERPDFSLSDMPLVRKPWED